MGRDANPKKWEYVPHTEAKHTILKHYLNGWFPKLGSWKSRILFFDGFAGRGVYNDGSEGSPVLALRLIADHSIAAERPDTVFEFLFVERDPENAEELQSQLAALSEELGGFPKNVDHRVEVGPFEDHAKVLLNDQKVPVFAFIDPFGFDGIPMELVRRFVGMPNTEVFVNLMVDWIGRFGEKKNPEAMAAAYGLPVEVVMTGYQGEQIRHEYLRDLYVKQLREQARFEHVLSFAMHGENGHVLYYLIYGTNHEAGVALMKEAMWKVDPISGSGFHDRTARETDALIELDEIGPDLVPLEDYLLKRYAGCSGVSFTEIKRAVLLETPSYRDTHASAVMQALHPKRISITKHGKSHDTWTVAFPAPLSRTY